MNRGYKYRIYPKKDQKIIIEKTFGCSRFIYNHLLEDRENYYKLIQEKYFVLIILYLLNIYYMILSMLQYKMRLMFLVHQSHQYKLYIFY